MNFLEKKFLPSTTFQWDDRKNEKKKLCKRHNLNNYNHWHQRTDKPDEMRDIYTVCFGPIKL